MEGRLLGKINLNGETSMKAIEFQEETETELERISWLSARDSNKEFCSLMHHFNVKSLRAFYKKLDGKKAIGTDRITKSIVYSS